MRLQLSKRVIDTTWRDYKVPFPASIVEIACSVEWRWATDGGAVYRVIQPWTREIVLDSRGVGVAGTGQVLFQFRTTSGEGILYEKITG